MSNQQLDVAAEETGSPSSPFASSSKFGYVGDRDNAGKKSGYGRLAYKNGDIYEGNWLNDKKHGEGFYSYENGDVFQGFFSNGVKSGAGSYMYARGELCSGTWVNGQMSVVNAFNDEDGRSIMKGETSKKHHFQPKTTRKVLRSTSPLPTTPSSSSSSSATAFGYVGERDTATGKRHGQGRMSFKNGDVHDGAWLNDKKHGHGTYFYENGDVFTGNFVYGLKSGEGSYLYARGELCSGKS
jgi:hypothetical protein